MRNHNNKGVYQESGGAARIFRLLYCCPVQQTTRSGISHNVIYIFRVGNQYAECEKQQQQRCLPRIVPSFFRRVGFSTPTTPRLLHRRLFCLLRVCDLRAFLLSSLRVPWFPQRAAVYQPCARLLRETLSLCWDASPPVDAVGRLALSPTTSRCYWQACTVTIDEFLHRSTSCRDSQTIFKVETEKPKTEKIRGIQGLTPRVDEEVSTIYYEYIIDSSFRRIAALYAYGTDRIACQFRR